MKKIVVFAGMVLISVATFSQTAQKQSAKKNSNQIIVNIPPNTVSDTATVVEQQFLRNIGDVKYRIIIREFPYQPRRNYIQTIRNQPMPAGDPWAWGSMMFQIGVPIDGLMIEINPESHKITIVYRSNRQPRYIEIE